ncbi:MAG: hydroxyacid dehydrogenase, partial [Candidatus Omnitrophica bacterium]|nr:hydroxyacid dehydrogenase [Candidatus Omnitrophota bacterium]
MMTKVVFYEVYEEEEAVLKKFLPRDFSADFFPKTIQEEGHTSPLAGVVSVRTQSVVPKAWASSLKGVLTRSQGFDHMTAFLKTAGRNIPCGYLDNYCSRAVAEHVLMIMMTLLKRLKGQIKAFDRFRRSGIMGTELGGKNVLVVGVGCIGEEVARLVKGVWMNVKGVDIVPNKPDVKYTSLEEGVSWADIIVCALPLTESTEKLLNYKLLSTAKPGVIFINISRGEISPIADMDRLLNENIFAGVAMDVYEEEGKLAAYLRKGAGRGDKNAAIVERLKTQDNVLFTPHNAFNTRESLERKAGQSIEALVHFFKEG